MRSNCVPSLENLGLRYSFERCISYLNSAQLVEGVTMAGDSGRSGSVYGSVAEPCTVVLFGASGDLAKRKFIPAMYDLAIHNGLGPRYAIVGFARTPMAEDVFRATLGEAAKSISEVGPIDPKQWDAFAANLYYSPGDYGNPEAYAQLAKRLTELESAKNIGGNRLFYLSTPPEVYPDIVEQLGRAGLSNPPSPKSWVRIIIEKPFGRDLASAKALNQMSSMFSTKSRSTASTITLVRTPCRPFSFCASATGFSSRSGTAIMSITCKSPRRKRSVSSAAAVFMKRRALSAT